MSYDCNESKLIHAAFAPAPCSLCVDAVFELLCFEEFCRDVIAIEDPSFQSIDSLSC